MNQLGFFDFDIRLSRINNIQQCLQQEIVTEQNSSNLN